MTPSLSAISILLVSAALGAPPPQKDMPPINRPNEPLWHDRFDMPWEVELAKLPFKNDDTRAACLRADAAIRKIAKPDWKLKAGETYKYLNWNSGSDGYNRTYQGKWESGGDTRHSLSLSTTLYHKTGAASGFTMGAMWEPPQGWKASLHCSHNSSAS